MPEPLTRVEKALFFVLWLVVIAEDGRDLGLKLLSFSWESASLQ